VKVGVIDTGVWPEHPMLADNGLPPIGGVVDDTITNFNVPSFFYGGEAYSRIGVVSNGTS
jgi:hypothetical protein